MSRKSRDPVDGFIEGAVIFLFEVVWAIAALLIGGAIKASHTPPEKKLQQKNDNSGWGSPSEPAICHVCNTYNDPEAKQCTLCGTQLKNQNSINVLEVLLGIGFFLFLLTGFACFALFMLGNAIFQGF